MSATFHAAGTFNGSNNKYKYQNGCSVLINADSEQDSGSPYMYDAAGNQVAKSETDLITTDGVANDNKQMYACFADSGNVGVAQYSAANSTPNDAAIKDWFECELQ